MVRCRELCELAWSWSNASYARHGPNAECWRLARGLAGDTQCHHHQRGCEQDVRRTTGACVRGATVPWRLGHRGATGGAGAAAFAVCVCTATFPYECRPCCAGALPTRPMPTALASCTTPAPAPDPTHLVLSHCLCSFPGLPDGPGVGAQQDAGADHGCRRGRRQRRRAAARAARSRHRPQPAGTSITAHASALPVLLSWACFTCSARPDTSAEGRNTFWAHRIHPHTPTWFKGSLRRLTPYALYNAQNLDAASALRGYNLTDTRSSAEGEARAAAAGALVALPRLLAEVDAAVEEVVAGCNEQVRRRALGVGLRAKL